VGHGLVGRYVGVFEDEWLVGVYDSKGGGSISKTSFDGSDRAAEKVLDELSDMIARISEENGGTMMTGASQYFDSNSSLNNEG